MKFKEAVQILGYKLEEKYRALGFKYKKSDRTLTMHSKNFTYMIAFFSFSGNTNEKIDVDVCYIINRRPYDPQVETSAFLTSPCINTSSSDTIPPPCFKRTTFLLRLSTIKDSSLVLSLFFNFLPVTGNYVVHLITISYLVFSIVCF